MSLEYIFNITYEVYEGKGSWLAVNDELPVTTSAKTWAKLVERVGLVAPEMALENGLCQHGDDIKLKFVLEQTVAAA